MKRILMKSLNSKIFYHNTEPWLRSEQERFDEWRASSKQDRAESSAADSSARKVIIDRVTNAAR